MSSLPPPPLPGDLPPNFDGRPVNEKRAVAALICGIVGLIFFPLVLGAVAIILGVQARGLIRRRPEVYKGENLALAGIILGSVSVVLFVVVVSTGIG